MKNVIHLLAWSGTDFEGWTWHEMEKPERSNYYPYHFPIEGKAAIVHVYSSDVMVRAEARDIAIAHMTGTAIKIDLSKI